jgi:hypothetical protein
VMGANRESACELVGAHPRWFPSIRKHKHFSLTQDDFAAGSTVSPPTPRGDSAGARPSCPSCEARPSKLPRPIPPNPKSGFGSDPARETLCVTTRKRASSREFEFPVPHLEIPLEVRPTPISLMSPGTCRVPSSSVTTHANTSLGLRAPVAPPCSGVARTPPPYLTSRVPPSSGTSTHSSAFGRVRVGV